MRLPPQLRIVLGPSRLGRAIVVVVAASTALLVPFLPLPWWGACLVALVLARWAARRASAFGPHRAPHDVASITLSANRLIVVHAVDGTLRAGYVRDATYVSPSLTSIVWKPDGARRSHVVLVLPDMLAPDDFRRLRVILRYGRREEVAGAPASHA